VGAQRGEGVGLGDDLAEHACEGVAPGGDGLEPAEVLEVVEEREGDLGAHVGRLEFAADQLRALHRVGAPGGVLVYSVGEGFTVPAGVGASEDDADLGQAVLSILRSSRFSKFLLRQVTA
jgi:hypothetical protein